MPTLKNIFIDGSGDVIIEDFANQESLNIDIDGSAEIVMNAFDHASFLNIDIDGSATYKSFPLSVDDGNIKIDGSGDYNTTVNESLIVERNGSGTFHTKVTHS